MMNGTKTRASAWGIAIAAVIAALWLIYGNAGAAQGEDSSVAEKDTGPTAVPTLTRDQFVTQLANESTHVISASQAKILDSSDTIADAYDQVGDVMLACLKGKGVQNARASQNETDGSWQFALPPSNQTLAAGVRSPYAECYWEHMDDIDRLWQQSPDVSAASVARGLEVLECVRAETPDIEFTRDGTESLNAQMYELDQRTNVVSECIRSVAGDSTQIKFEVVPE